MSNEYYDGEDKSYHFYDEMGDIEDINTGEDITQSSTPAKLGLIPSILALTACLVLLALTSVIYHRDKKSIPLSHLIMCTIAILASGFTAFIFLQSKNALNKRGEANNLLIGIALLLALFFFGYFLGASIYCFMYRPFHYGFLVERFNDEGDWGEVFGDNWTFEDAWGEDRRILWWIAFFNVVAAVGFLVVAVFMWQLSRFKIQSAKMCVGAACLAGVVLGCFAVEYLLRTIKFYDNYVFQNVGMGFLTAFFIMLIVIIGLLFLNAIFNIFKKRIFHFLFAMLLIISLFILVCFMGLALRDLRNRQFNQINDTKNCSSMLDSLHEEDIKNECPNKYLSQPCTKDYLVNHWETDNKPQFLNPGCCHAISNYLLWPLYICGCLTLLLIAACLIAIAFNLYLSDKSEYLELEDKSLGIFEIVFAILCLLCLIAFAFYWGFRPSVNAPRTNENNPDVIYSGYLNQGVEVKDNDFEVVDMNKAYNGKPPVNAFSLNKNSQGPDRNGRDSSMVDPEIFTKNSIITVDLNDGQCPTNKDHCGMRIAILIINGKLSTKIPENIKGSPESRNIFYQDKNIFNDYLLIFGKENDLNNFLSTFKIIPNDIGKKTVVAFIGQQIDLSTLNSLGLKTSENTSSIVLTENGIIHTNFDNFLIEEHTNKTCYYTNNCPSTLKCLEKNNSVVCEKSFIFHNSDGEIDVKIPLKVLDVNNKRVNYPDTTLKSHSFYTYNNKKTILNNVNLVDSNLVIKIPKPINNELFLDVSLYDSAGRYLPVDKSYSIPVNSKNPYLAEELLLLTKNGKGCVGSINENDCWANNNPQFDPIEVLVKSEEKNEIVKNIKVNLYNSKGVMMGSAVSDNYGYANFPSSNFDNYSLSFNGNDIFIPASKNFILSSQKKGDTTLYLNEKFTTSAVLEEGVYNSETGDQDFALKIRSIKNKECIVDPLNKWCAYAEHIKDVEKNQNGYEKIKINKFTISHYLAYLKNAPIYSGTCPAADFSNSKYYPKSESTIRSLKSNLTFNWQNVRKLSLDNYQTLYCFTGWGLNSTKMYRVNGQGEPDIQGCVDMYPTTSSYNLNKLVDVLSS